MLILSVVEQLSGSVPWNTAEDTVVRVMATANGEHTQSVCVDRPLNLDSTKKTDDSESSFAKIHVPI